MSGFSLNMLAGALADRLVEDAALFRVGVRSGPYGETLVDCGAGNAGGIAAGLRLAEICMGGIGSVSIVLAEATPHWPWQVVVRAADPVTACLASQRAGWNLKHEDAAGDFVALGSGPARALARKEPIFEELSHREIADRAVLVVEGESAPPPPIVAEIAEAGGVAPQRLVILYAPTRSLAGSVQVTARVVEVALHKAHALGFPLAGIADAIGAAPLSPPHPDLTIAMGRTNDAIIFGGRVQLFVTGPADAARALADALPSCRSRDYGAPFAEIFERAGRDFYAVDALLFSPAEVAVTTLDTGETFRAGTIAADLLDAALG